MLTQTRAFGATYLMLRGFARPVVREWRSRHPRLLQRGMADTDPSTRGRSSVVLEVHFRSRSFLKMQIQIEILPCYLHYLDYCTVQRSVVLLVLPCRNTFSNFASITGWSYIQTFFSSDLEGRLLLETKASHQKRKKISGETDIANPTKILST